MITWVERIANRQTDIRIELEKLREKYEQEEQHPEEFPRGFGGSDYEKFESLFPEFREVEKTQRPTVSPEMAFKPYNPFRQPVTPPTERERPIATAKVTEERPFGVEGLPDLELIQTPEGEVVRPFKEPLTPEQKYWGQQPVPPEFMEPVARKISETAIGAAETPLFSVGGVNISAGDITALGLIGYGTYQAITVGIPAAYRALMRSSLTRNINSWSKSKGIEIPAETKEFFTETIIQNAKPSWMTKQAIKTLFKPLKGTIQPTPQATRQAEATSSQLVKQNLPDFLKIPRGTQTGAMAFGGVPKQPWQMTNNEYLISKIAPAYPQASEEEIRRIVGQIPDRLRETEHKQLIQQALSEGKPVPAEVLRDYPDLKPPAVEEAPPVTPEVTETIGERAKRVSEIRQSKEYQTIQKEWRKLQEEKGATSPEALALRDKLVSLEEVKPEVAIPKAEVAAPEVARPITPPAEVAVAPPPAVTEGIPPTVPPPPPETGITSEPPVIEPSGKINFASLQDTQAVIDYSTKPDVSRWIANLPVVKQIMSRVNPSAIADTTAEKAILARNVLREEGTQKAQGIVAYLGELGSQEKLFGKLDDKGFIAQGKLKGLSVNDIRTYPKRYADKLTHLQKEWIDRAHEIEVAKLKFMRDNDIEIKELAFMEGGEYAGRRVFAKMSSDGELLDTGYVGAGPTRVGKKTAFEKRRWFTTAKEALDDGYRYLPDDEALALNVRAAYNRVADKQMSEWLLTQVPWRTTGAPEELILAAESAKMRLNRSLQLSAAINRAVRGERVPDATINSIARVYPEEALELKLAITEIQAGRPTAESIQQLTKGAKALIKSDRADWNAAVNARARAREKAMTPSFGEAMVMHPAFSGKIFTGPEAKELADTMRKALEPNASKALKEVNKVNALVRYFLLAGDFSPLGIQLIFLAGQNPKIYGGAAASIPKILLHTEFMPRFLSEHKAVIDRHPGLLLSTAGTEFTEAMAKGGMLSTKINVLPGQESILKQLALVNPRLVGKVGATILQPFQRVFEGTLDYAGIKMAEALEHLAKTPAEMAEVDQFINEFRGLTSSAKLGVSPNWRAGETATVLAPRYNRAIAALLVDAIKGATTFGQSGIRNRLAIQGLTKGVAAIAAMAVAISLALNENWEDIAEHFDPNSPRFFTWNIAGTNIGPGTKVRSVVKLVAQSLDNPEALFQLAMENPALRFVRGNLAPVLGSSVDLLTGRNYIGDPVRSDAASFTKEMIAGNFLPIWVENVIYEGGSLSQRLLRGAGEFFGGRAYPETKSDQVNRLRERYAAKEYGQEYEDLNNAQRSALRQKYDDLAKIEEEAKIYWAERGSEVERFYFNEKQRLINERNAGLEKAAQAYLDGSISKYEYDKQRGYIRPYYSGGREVLWSAKETLDEYSVKQLEKWLDENEKPEDKALGEYQEHRAGLIESADLPIDWDVLERELESYLGKYPPDIQAYILANVNNWINDLPPAAKQVEQERASGIDDDTWWDDYRGGSQGGRNPFRVSGATSGRVSGIKNPFRS